MLYHHLWMLLVTQTKHGTMCRRLHKVWIPGGGGHHGSWLPHQVWQEELIIGFSNVEVIGDLNKSHKEKCLITDGIRKDGRRGTKTISIQLFWRVCWRGKQRNGVTAGEESVFYKVREIALCLYVDGNSPTESEKLLMYYRRERITGALPLSRRDR